MTFVWWLLILSLFALSFVGIIMPVIPGVTLIWIGLLLYHFIFFPLVGWQFWLTMFLLTALTIVVDFLASSTWVKRKGGSRLGVWAAIVGILVGPIVFGPLGIIIGPFFFVTGVEMFRGVPWNQASQIGLASLIGLLGGSLVKAVIFLLMIFIFFFKIWF
ncbi:DUF456 domain-containing protein [Tepidibacillus fermentans]|uniref:DUF456 family protein n=1 Tax=Tepidibacillus fermentans TaxID=1281767 RepID=A0A4R3KJ95_9BACI|nr:DUF456 family protein [Tepidibacillus fermentans]TCS83208.1 hypothetical protein EDD72_106137 [Tepidibacillus fermentans]